MDDGARQNPAYFLKGVQPVATESSALVSSSKYLNDPAIREWLALHFLRRNGPDLPTAGDTSNGLVQALHRIRDFAALDRLIAAEKEKNPKFKAWLDAKPVCRHTVEDFGRYDPASFGGVYYRYVVDNDFQLNLGWSFPKTDADREYILFRSGQIHDFEHIVTGGQFNTLGELLPYFARLSNLHANLSPELASALFTLHVFGGFRMVMRAALHYPATWLTVVDLMRRGVSIGLDSECILMGRFEEIFHLTPAEARQAMGVRNAEDLDTSEASRIFDGEMAAERNGAPTGPDYGA
ncbi:Coq4 family protein [Phenylobacterium sp.]|jgi:ubiquinone biosynthesis protein Coq4|uniref:Coq4 family protein n=1 Tax=Phenylobacterium sp. TaxID=1871053 RepID=UPI002F3E9344